MLEIDGSDAGGQLVRTAVALSAITGKAFRIKNIRGARPEPGLKTQHLEGISAIAEWCNAGTEGLELGSREILFNPKKFEPHDIEIKISTAGSIGLVLQALMICATKLSEPVKVKFVGGGTWGKWAPPILYLDKVFSKFMGIDFDVKILREGFYPKGGGQVEVELKPFSPKKLEILEHGKLLEINIFSMASAQLQKAKVAERQAEAAKKFLSEKFSTPVTTDIFYSPAESPGSGILIVGKCESSILGADSIGELKISAEDVGKRAAKDFLLEYSSGAVDRHCADMLMPYMALAYMSETEGQLQKSFGKIQTSEITQHILTSAELIEKFLPINFEIDKERKIISV